LAAAWGCGRWVVVGWPAMKLDFDDDGYLVRRAQAGFLDAFELLVVRHRDRVLRVALRLLGDPQDAEDAAQEAFIDAWRALPRFRQDSSFVTWLHRIVVNRCLQQRRRGRESAPLPEAEVAGGPGPEQVVEERSRAAALRAAIAELPAELRVPLVLVEFGGFTYGETATILSESPATVRGRIYRARKGLVEAMRQWR